ncbi:MAG: hypothetical protein NZT92_14995 [Abditibacteriales bacterium]|nr:hypothetical protein [Abditibacteriales bacterium]MDW8367083.1 hypothetical protein [Abditibacteriales bacterium]
MCHSERSEAIRLAFVTDPQGCAMAPLCVMASVAKPSPPLQQSPA